MPRASSKRLPDRKNVAWRVGATGEEVVLFGAFVLVSTAAIWVFWYLPRRRRAAGAERQSAAAFLARCRHDVDADLDRLRSARGAWWSGLLFLGVLVAYDVREINWDYEVLGGSQRWPALFVDVFVWWSISGSLVYRRLVDLPRLERERRDLA